MVLVQQLWHMTYGMMLKLPRELIFCVLLAKYFPYHQAPEGRKESHKYYFPPEEIQDDTVPNPEPICFSSDSRFNYCLISCDRYARNFRSIGIKDKSSGACIDGIEQIIFNILHLRDKSPKSIVHIKNDFDSELRHDTFRE